MKYTHLSFLKWHTDVGHTVASKYSQEKKKKKEKRILPKVTVCPTCEMGKAAVYFKCNKHCVEVFIAPTTTSNNSVESFKSLNFDHVENFLA